METRSHGSLWPLDTMDNAAVVQQESPPLQAAPATSDEDECTSQHRGKNRMGYYWFCLQWPSLLCVVGYIPTFHWMKTARILPFFKLTGKTKHTVWNTLGLHGSMGVPYRTSIKGKGTQRSIMQGNLQHQGLDFYNSSHLNTTVAQKGV